MRNAAASDPPDGSVSAKALRYSPRAIGRRYFSRCSAVPKATSGPQPTELCPLMTQAVAASPAAISSIASVYDT